MRYCALILAGSILAAAVLPESTSAQPYRARQGVQSGEVRSLDEILNGIRRERPGNLSDVQGPNPSPAGDPRYRLKWLTPDGRVLWLNTDARTGRVLGVEGDDRGPPAPPARGVFSTRPGNFVPGGPAQGPPQGYGRGPPPGYDRPPPPGYGRGPPPPGYGRPPPPDYGPPLGYDPRPRGGGPPPGFGRVPPPGFGGIPPRGFGRPGPPPPPIPPSRGGFPGGR